MSEKLKTKTNGKVKLAKKPEREKIPLRERLRMDPRWFTAEAKRWYILLGLSAMVSLLLFPNVLTRSKIYQIGDVADRNIKASQEFLIQDSELTEKTRQEAVRAVIPVYDLDPAAANIDSRLRDAFKAARNFRGKILQSEESPENRRMKTEVYRKTFFETLDIPEDRALFDSLYRIGFPSEVEEATINLISQILKNGLVGNKEMLLGHTTKGIVVHNIHSGNEIKVSDLSRFYDLEDAKEILKGQSNVLTKLMPSRRMADVSLTLAGLLIKPNLTFNKRETELRKELALQSVKPFYFKVKKGEMLVREGERITGEHLLKLSERSRLLKRKEMIIRAPAVAVLVGFLLFAMYMVGLMGRRTSRDEVKDLLFNAITLLFIFLIVIAADFIADEMAQGFHLISTRALVYAIPVASGAMLVSIFHGMGVAASFSLIASVLTCLVIGGQVEFFVYFFISSLVGGYGVRYCRERGILIKAGLKVGLINMVLAFCIEAIYGPFYTIEALIGVASAFIGGVFVGVIATGILPLVEMSFGYTTDIKLLELANLDQALLRDLMIQAPGTYHHSVIVSNMVEATGKAVNANSLLAKVAAYYHDIGKMKKPHYFIENQMESENKHEKLAPSMSSLILISHVKDGIELAKEHKLGKEIIDIIAQHHGTSLITFFYEKAKEQRQKKGQKTVQIKEEDFRYPGPKPQTKEAGLVMLADAVEAASRTLVDPTAARIQGLVQTIINKAFSDGQLNDCELTLKDLNEIAKSFNKTLSGIFHHRVEYPEPVTKPQQPKKGENGDSDSLSEKNSRGKKPEDKAETEESLKRLGLS
jgi:putative nucleotidyltransferase with HDIG domain